jgi:hypothetical protein
MRRLQGRYHGQRQENENSPRGQDVEDREGWKKLMEELGGLKVP